MKPWEPKKLREGETARWEVGPLDLWVMRTPGEWRVAGELKPDLEERLAYEAGSEPPDGAAWRRWALNGPQDTVTLKPLLPDRPIIVRPDGPLVIPPARNAQFFVSLPLWLRVSVGEGAPVDLCDERTVTLTNSWFGGPTEGELCYALRSRAKGRLEELNLRPYRAVCPVELRNRARTPLDFQRLCLRVAHLSVYQGTRHLWTNAARVTFQGENQLSRVVYGRAAPPYDGADREIGAPRDASRRGFLSRSFNDFVTLALP